jgi:hypothetical protein
MINIDMKHYNYFTFGDVDEYGQEQLSANVKGQVKMAIYTSTQSIQDNVNYKSAQYIGLTKDNVNDTFVIQIAI